MKLADVYSFDTDNETLKVTLPKGGGVLHVYTIDSQKYCTALARYRARMKKVTEEGKELFDKCDYDGTEAPSETLIFLQAILMAEVVESWDFEDELNIETLVKLFVANPKILDQIELKLYSIYEEKIESKKN